MGKMRWNLFFRLWFLVGPCAHHASSFAIEKSLSTATSTSRKSRDQSHLPELVRKNLKQHGYEYYCRTCSVGFSKEKNYWQHINGKKHKELERQQFGAWDEIKTGCPTWLPDDATINNLDVQTKWREKELENFPHDLSCIDTSLTINTLAPHLRCRFWRYLKDEFGEHFPELPSIFHHMSIENPQYLRVKELFETLESFKLIGNIIAQHPNVDTIYDLACGHGWLGTLLAYRFPTKNVICVDIKKRESFNAFRFSFIERGESYQDRVPVSNLDYREEDLANVGPSLASSSFLCALHACNEANRDVAEMANRVNACWAVMPCCIRSGLYLGGAPILDLDSETRYKLLCGTFAEANNASIIRSISRHITARPIIIAGGWTDTCKTETEKNERRIRNTSGRSMPPL